VAASAPLRCAGALILDDEGRIFVQRRAPTRRLFPNCWDIVGGHLEPGESHDDALRREITEETGWRLSHVLAELDEISYTGDDGIDRVERDFLVRVEGNLFSPHLQADEHTEWRWIDESQIDLIDEHRASGDKLAREIVSAGFRLARELGLA
jgi:8-oxo-dGTP pyrophosphatase MutT (NUDIX family)